MSEDEARPTVGRAARALTADPAWLRNVAIGVGVNLIPYIGMFWFMGYALTYLRDAAWDPRAGLPRWQPAGERLKTGLYAFVAGMVYSLPLSIVFGLAMAAAVIGGTLGLVRDGALWPTVILLSSVFGVFVLVSVAYGIVLWPVYVNVALHQTVESGFDLGGIYRRVRDHRAVFWPTAWRALGLGLLSTTLGMAGLVLAIVAVVGGAMAVLPDEMAPLAPMLLLPAEVLGVVVTSFVTVPIGLVTYRLWAGYARAAYGLGPVGAETSPDQS
jgi:hypothetical protein